MKKAVTVVLAVVLIAVIAWFTFGKQVVDKYSYSDERADLYEYFSLEKEDEVAVVLQNEFLEEKALLLDGICYFDLDTVHKYFNERFYVDKTEELVLYTTATEVIRTAIGTEVYSRGGEEVDTGHRLTLAKVSGEDTVYYISIDYIKKFTNLSYEFFAGPNRLQIYTQWPQRTVADVTGDNAVRKLGGVKSPILCDVKEGDKVVVLEKMETWCKVKTGDGFIGYIENKILENERTEVPEAVTDYEAPEYTNLTRDRKIALGWHAVYGPAGNDQLEELVSVAKGMNVIAPTWFSLSDTEGNFQSFAQQSYVDRAHELGLEVWGVLDNFNYRLSDGKKVDSAKIFASTTVRTKLIEGLIEEALEYDLDGINVDLEDIGPKYDANGVEIAPSYGPDYVQFMREMSIACREAGLVLSVDIPVPFNFNSYYNVKELGVVSDYVIIMGYDQHGEGSKEAGSVAPLDYVTSGLNNTTKVVASNKVINALPFYTRLWKTKGVDVESRAYGLTAVKGLVSDYGMTVVWDEETNQNYASVEKDGVKYEMWIEDTTSILAKINVMKKYNLGGVAAWRLGYEKSDIWEIISAYILQ